MWTFLKRLTTLAAGGAVGQLAAAAAAPALSRLYDPTDYGFAGLVQSVVIVLALAATLRYDAVIVAGRSETSRAAAVGLSTAALLGCAALLALGVLLAMGARAYGLSAFASASPLYLFAAVILPLNVMQHRILPPVLINDGRYRLVSLSAAASGAGGALAQIGFGFLGLGAVGLLLGRTLGQIAAVATQALPTRRGALAEVRRRLRWRNLRRVAWGHRRQALLLAPAGLVNTLAMQLPVFVIAASFGVAASGAYFFAQALANALLGVYTRSMNPLIARYVRDRRAAQRRILPFVARLLGVVAAGGFGLAFLLYLLAERLTPIVFGAEWAGAGIVFKWLGLFYAAAAVHAPLSALSTILNFQGGMLATQFCQLVAIGAALGIGVHLGDLETAVALVGAASTLVYLVNTAVVLALMRRDDLERRAKP